MTDTPRNITCEHPYDCRFPECLCRDAESDEELRAAAVAEWPKGEMCAGCAGRKGSEANETPETVEMLQQCIRDGEPFFCHESSAVRDPRGGMLDKHGKRYRSLPFERWRLCRAWMNAQ